MRSALGGEIVEAVPKKTRQGRGKHTKYAASSRNKAKNAQEVKENKKGVDKVLNKVIFAS